MFQKMYVDKPDEWIDVEESDVKEKLSAYYNNVDDVINDIKAGSQVRTPWAYFRYVKEG